MKKNKSPPKLLSHGSDLLAKEKRVVWNRNPHDLGAYEKVETGYNKIKDM